MIRLLKVLFVLAVMGFVALAGYAYLGDLSPEQNEVTETVTLDG